MNIDDFIAGKMARGFKNEYFIPESINQVYTWEDPAINELLETASCKMGELNAYARWIPDVGMFIKMHIYKEAVVSSKIEGTQTNMEEALLEKKEVLPEHRDDWQEVNNYVEGMNYALDEMKKISLSNRLFRKTHAILLHSARGEKKTPGEFRTSQNWIGGATIQDASFIPPVHDLIPELMADLEKFIHNDDLKVPHIIKAAIMHYQFETIHPFLDGNGRLGRLMITLYLVHSGVLNKPLLYLSDFFEKNKLLYYDNLMKVRVQNDLRQWILFFLVAIKETAEKATSTLEQIVTLKSSLNQEAIQKLGRRAQSAQKLYDHMYTQPILSIKEIAQFLNLTPKSAGALLQQLLGLGAIREITGGQRSRLYAFEAYLNLYK